MNERKALTELRILDYVHPSEARFRGRDSEQASVVQKGVDALGDISVELLSTITKGRYVEVSEKSDPRLVELVTDVCRILNYAPLPRLYICHERSMKVTAGGTDKAQILIPDYVLTHFDQDMLYYAFGNAIAMLKAGHAALATICSVMIDNAATKPFKLILEAYMRSADMTSDRGALLCCQSFPAAARCMLAEAGVPVAMLREMNDAQIETAVEAFLEETRDRTTNLLTDLSAFLMRLNWSDSPVFIRLRELYAWYQSDYAAVLQRACKGGESI